MGSWQKDQSKLRHRYLWGQTRGEKDATLRDFMERVKAYPALAKLRPEKIGSEIQCWRQIPDGKGKLYWSSCVRFIDDGWGYWTIMGRSDEGRWRNSHIEGLPLSKALAAGEEYYLDKLAPPSIDSANRD